ncbi:MAG TPA: hypothetical protein VIJ68_04430 [Candidatus Saccharimonadales bacterium]
MKRISIRQAGLTLGLTVSTIGLALAPASALAAAKSTSATSATDQAKLKLIINRGNNEITRRLATLKTLSSKISGATKLTADDKTSLSGEVNDETSGLTALQTKLDADTTVADARTDAQSIISGYRVYALIVPKVNLIKTADDQQVAEGKLAALAPKLQSRITAAQAAGKTVTSLQSGLTDLNKQTAAAQVISSKIEASVVGLQPSDFNSDHTILSGDRDQLKTAQNEIQAAVSDATTIVSGLKNL